RTRDNETSLSRSKTTGHHRTRQQDIDPGDPIDDPKRRGDCPLAPIRRAATLRARVWRKPSALRVRLHEKWRERSALRGGGGDPRRHASCPVVLLECPDRGP